MTHLADDAPAIKARLREIRAEEGRADDDMHTATGADLDLIAARYGLARKGPESDYALRERVVGSVGT